MKYIHHNKHQQHILIIAIYGHKCIANIQEIVLCKVTTILIKQGFNTKINYI